MMTAVLERVTVGHHLFVGAVAAGCSALAFAGLIGEPEHEERFDAKQVTVVPAGGDALRIREVIDQDFGSQQRRGHERFVPTDFGRPLDVTASSPDAPDDVSVVPMASEVRIRIGDPDVTITGQHRYVLEFTLPDARVSTGELALDIIGTEETLETERFEVVVAGLELDDPTCNVGALGATGGCELVRVGDVYRAVISPLRRGEGITIGGRITATERVTMPPVPPLPERREPHDRLPLTLGLLPLGLVTGAGVYLTRSRRGRNEVFAGGAADAAFGSLPAPAADAAPVSSSTTTSTTTSATTSIRDRRSDATTSAPTRLVTDRRLGDLATIEFAPPVGLEPWQGAVLLRERIDDESVAAWFSGLAGREIITLDTVGKSEKLSMAWGPKRLDADRSTERLLNTVLSGKDRVVLGTYNANFASLWQAIRTRQDEQIKASGWWKHQPPQSGTSGGCSMFVVLVIVAMLAMGFGSAALALLGLVANAPAAIAFTVIVSAVAARVVYRTLLPARSAAGSALALRTESFRRFLAASEGQHVQWAWERGVLREYTAWAVALGTAEAWSRALAAANVPPAAVSASSPMLVHSMRSSFSSSRTAPSSSGSGSSSGSSSSGGFSGGSVGGGGGGGRSGSW